MTDLRAAVEGLRDRSQRQGTWGIEYGDDRFMADILALIPEGAVLVTEEGLARLIKTESVRLMDGRDAVPVDALRAAFRETS